MLNIEHCSQCMDLNICNLDEEASILHYLRQFEAVVKKNGWTRKKKALTLMVSLRGEVMDVLQTLSHEEMQDHEELVKNLKIHTHLYNCSLHYCTGKCYGVSGSTNVCGRNKR